MEQIAARPDVNFQKLFLVQETEGDDDTTALGAALVVMKRRWPKFKAADIADLISPDDADDPNRPKIPPDVLAQMRRDRAILRDFLYGHVPANFVATPGSVGMLLKAHLDEPVKFIDETLVLRGERNRNGVMVYLVHTKVDAE